MWCWDVDGGVKYESVGKGSIWGYFHTSQFCCDPKADFIKYSLLIKEKVLIYITF